MPDFGHSRFSYSRMNPVLGESGFPAPQQQQQMTGQPDPAIPDPGYFLGDNGGFGSDPLSGLDLGALPPSSGLAYLHRVPPVATALRNDLGSNISVLKTLNLRFRCFLAKVHELERRNKVLEKQLQQALDSSSAEGQQRPLTKNMGVQTGFIGPIPTRPNFIPLHNVNNPAYLPGGLLSPTLNPPALMDNKYTDSNANLTTFGFPISPNPSPSDPNRTVANMNDKHTGNTLPPPPRFIPGTIWSFNHARRFGTGSCTAGPGVSWTQPGGVGVQIDTITPEIRALYNVLSKVKRERDEYKRRWEEEYTARVDLQDKVMELEEDLQESEVYQVQLALRVKQLKAELVLFKGLMSNNLSELDSKIQEKAMKVDMDICRRIDITARLCDVAQQRNCEDVIQMYRVPGNPPQVPNNQSSLSLRRKQTPLSFNGSECDEPISTSESDAGVAKDEERFGSSANQINEEMQRMLTHLRECEFEDDCDSLAWEETEETLLLWEDFPGCTLPPDPTHPPGEEDCLEKVINDTECLFKSREKEYQETIGQIELELATAKSDMNRHLHEYMEMCSMKRGLDVQMETCRRLITQSGDNNPSAAGSTEESDLRENDRSLSPPSSSSSSRS
uniref:Intermediate filament family orphan 1 n=1 Tax=Nothobranchius pienaari TaxID=704102 RepID=A0A1A8NE79_9TELE